MTQTSQTSAENSSPSRFRATPHYLGVVLMSWLIPGAGHVLLGYHARGLVLGGAILSMFWFGELVLADRMAVTREVHWIFYALQLGNGASTLAANTLWGAPRHPDQTEAIQDDLPVHLNLGILFCTVSGLLNLLVVLHVMDPRTWKEAASHADDGDSDRSSFGSAAPEDSS